MIFHSLSHYWGPLVCREIRNGLVRPSERLGGAILNRPEVQNKMRQWAKKLTAESHVYLVGLSWGDLRY